MLRRLIYLIFCFLLHFAGRAQINLIRNPSFEDTIRCVDLFDEISYTRYWSSLDTLWSWSSGDLGVPDLALQCADVASMVNIPNGRYWHHSARTGAAMANCQMFHFDGYHYTVLYCARDYLQQKLETALIAGHTYVLNYFVALARSSCYAVNHLGAYFDDGSIDTCTNYGALLNQFHPQVQCDSILRYPSFDDSTTWFPVTGTFVANGTERFMTIGQFTDPAHTSVYVYWDTTGAYAGGWYVSYYIIDDVSLIDCATRPFAGNDTLIHPGDSAFLGTHEGLIPWVWYVLGSSTPIDSGGGLWVHPTATTKYVVTQDICGDGVKTDTITVHVWPDTPIAVKPIIIDPIDVNVYPNPATSVVTIDGGRGCTLEIYNAVGQVVLRKESLAKRDIIDVSELEVGDYLAEVVNPVSGVRVVRRVGRR